MIINAFHRRSTPTQIELDLAKAARKMMVLSKISQFSNHGHRQTYQAGE